MVTRSGLPQKYTYVSAQSIETFQSAADWSQGTCTASDVSITEDTTHYKTGTRSVRLVGTNGIIRYDKTVSLDLSERHECNLWIYLNSALSTIGDIRILFGNSSNSFVTFGDYVASEFTVSGSYFLRPGWNCLKLGGIYPSITSWGIWYKVGNFSPLVRMRLMLTTNGNTTADVSFCLLESIKQRPKCMLVFDDGVVGQYTKAYAYMQPRGLRGTIYVISDLVGTTNYCTDVQLDEMYDAGWCMANHTASHAHPATLSLAEQESDISECTAYLSANGWSRGLKHFAYPYGEYNLDSKTALADLGFFTGRTTRFGYWYPSELEFYELHSVVPESLSVGINWIKYAISQGSSIALLIHDPYDLTGGQATFEGICDFLCQNRASIDTITVDEWYNGLTNPRYRSLPVGRT